MHKKDDGMMTGKAIGFRKALGNGPVWDAPKADLQRMTEV